MKLTDEEKRMQDGSCGPSMAQAMAYLVSFGDACDADYMVDISYAHINPGQAHHTRDIPELLELAGTGAKVRVPTTTTQTGTDMEQWERMGAPADFAGRQMMVMKAHKSMGVAGTYSCTPYLMGYLPLRGTHIASIESSAVIYFNSILGARTNRDGPFAVYAALTGKYPACGYHLDENRKGTHLVQVEARLDGLNDYGALGFCIGQMVGGGVPVIKGLSFPNQEALIAMGSAMATSGQIALYHIPGITAECSSVEEVSTKKTIQQTVHVKDTHIKAVYDLLHTAKTESVDFVNLGCPHYSLEQMRRVAFLIKGRKVKEGVLFWVFTNRAIKAIADRSGYTHVIEEAGGLVICDCCGTTSHLRQTTRRNLGLPVPAIGNMITDSAKQAKYANTSIGCTTIFARTEDCIEAAVTGRAMG